MRLQTSTYSKKGLIYLATWVSCTLSSNSAIPSQMWCGDRRLPFVLMSSNKQRTFYDVHKSISHVLTVILCPYVSKRHWSITPSRLSSSSDSHLVRPRNCFPRVSFRRLQSQAHPDCTRLVPNVKQLCIHGHTGILTKGFAGLLER